MAKSLKGLFIFGLSVSVFGVNDERKMELIINVYFETSVGREIHAASANIISG